MAGLKIEDRLQQYFDGETDAEEGRHVREALEQDEALGAKLEGLSHLRVLLNVHTEAVESEIDADSDALFARIEARAAEAAPADDDPMFPRGSQPKPEASAETPAAPAVPAATAKAPALTVVGGTKRRTAASPVWWISGAGILAAAAALLFVIARSGTDGPATDPLVQAPPPGSEVVEVDFGYSTGAIFAVEGQAGEHYAVVWVSDEKASVGLEEERFP